MYQFRDKTVFVISPERWGLMKVSKHHYALELAKMGCRVYFIEPPLLTNSGIQITQCPDHPLISIVKYKPVFRAKRFLPGSLFNILLRLQINKLLGKISIKPDVVLSFHGYLFENLRWFGAPVNIFFAADQFFYDEIPPEINSADFSLAISDTIYDRILQKGGKVFRINHGLHGLFVKGAEELLGNGIAKKSADKKALVAGYTGNLRMQAMDRNIMKHVIENNPDVKFIFWGSHRKNDLNLGGIQDAESDEFIDFLEHSSNVDLRGVVNSEQLYEQMKEADLFWLCWNTGMSQLWDGSNSHKILEYLSTGKPVVSHYVSSYKDTSLLYMLNQKTNTGFEESFKQVLGLIKEGEAKVIIENRLKFAVQNSYANNVHKIAELINHV